MYMYRWEREIKIKYSETLRKLSPIFPPKTTKMLILIYPYENYDDDNDYDYYDGGYDDDVKFWLFDWNVWFLGVPKTLRAIIQNSTLKLF